MDFEVVGPLRNIETIATGRAIRELKRLRKRKGIATVRLQDDTILRAEVHWYEAHGIGRREMKIKFPLLD